MAMRFFTRAWCEGALTDADDAALREAYARHCAAIWPALPPALQTLAQLSLHDGQFHEVAIDQAQRRVLLRLRCGDLQRGYVDLTLDYAAATLHEAPPYCLTAVGSEPAIEVLADEVDVIAGGRFVHRLLLWPTGTVVIECASLALAQQARATRIDP